MGKYDYSDPVLGLLYARLRLMELRAGTDYSTRDGKGRFTGSLPRKGGSGSSSKFANSNHPRLDKYAKGDILKGGYNPQDISRAIHQKGTNFVTKDINNPESLYGELIESIPPKKGYYDIKCHGSPTNVKVFDSVISADELARIIVMRSDYNGEPIRLLCCETGKGSNCFAKQLSNMLGVEVQAPTEIIFALSSGGFEVGTEKGLKNGEMKAFSPD